MGLVAFVIFCSQALAESNPSWINRAPAPDSEYRYYVGRGIAELETQAFQDATRDAMDAAIRENFGVVTSISVANYESLSALVADKRTSESSGKVRLESFEKVDSHVVRARDLVRVYLLFRYTKIAVEAEKARLAGDANNIQEIESISGPSSTGTELMVHTTPAGAEVFIDDVRWGLSPILIRGSLGAGVHKLKIDHSDFETVEESLILAKSGSRQISKILQPATAKLTVNTTPEFARVEINGVRTGKAPIKEMTLPAGKKVIVEAIFDEKNSVARSLILTKGESREIHLDLPQQEPKTEEHSSTDDNFSFFDSSKNLFGLGMGGSGANIPKPFGQTTFFVNLSYEFRFVSFLGLRASGALEMGLGRSSEDLESNSSSTGRDESTLTGHSYLLGLPIYFNPSHYESSFYIMPEVGRIKYSFEEAESTTTNAKKRDPLLFSYGRSGLTLGVQIPQYNMDVYLSVLEYNWEQLGHKSAVAIGIQYFFGK